MKAVVIREILCWSLFPSESATPYLLHLRPPSCPKNSICGISHLRTAVHHHMECPTTEHGWNSWYLPCLAQMTCVGVSTHFIDLVIVHTATHVQDGHRLVRSTLSQCRQPTVVGAGKDLRAALSLCAYRVCWDMFVVGMYLLDKNVVNKFIWLSSCWVSSSYCVYIF